MCVCFFQACVQVFSNLDGISSTAGHRRGIQDSWKARGVLQKASISRWEHQMWQHGVATCLHGKNMYASWSPRSIWQSNCICVQRPRYSLSLSGKRDTYFQSLSSKYGNYSEGKLRKFLRKDRWANWSDEYKLKWSEDRRKKWWADQLDEFMLE